MLFESSTDLHIHLICESFAITLLEIGFIVYWNNEKLHNRLVLPTACKEYGYSFVVFKPCEGNENLFLQDQSFLQDTSFKDLTLLSMDGRSVRAHSFILAAKSLLLKHHLSRLDSCLMRTMIFKGIPFRVLERFVEFLYSDNIELSRLDMKQATDLFMFADHYDIPGLKYFLEAFILCKISSESCAQLIKEIIGKTKPRFMMRVLNHFQASDENSFNTDS